MFLPAELKIFGTNLAMLHIYHPFWNAVFIHIQVTILIVISTYSTNWLIDICKEWGQDNAILRWYTKVRDIPIVIFMLYILCLSAYLALQVCIAVLTSRPHHI